MTGSSGVVRMSASFHLGSSYSSISVNKSGQIEIIVNEDGERMIPTCVSILEDEVVKTFLLIDYWNPSPRYVYSIPREYYQRFFAFTWKPKLR